MAHVVVMHPDLRGEARIFEALAAHHRCTAVSGWPELERLLEREDADGCVVDADTPSRSEALAAIGGLRRRHPDLALVVHADLHDADPELVRLGGMGVDAVLQARRPPWASGIRRATEGALASARARQAARIVGGRLSREAREALAWAVEHAYREPTVGRMAGALGHTPGSLGGALRQAGLPSPARVLLWGRLIHAGALLARDGRTVESSALHLGYATAGALSRAMRREVGSPPTEVARQGGLPFVVGRLFPQG